MQQFIETWKQLEASVTSDQNVTSLALGVYLLLGGVLALYIRLLYRKCSVSASETDSITRVFPLLTLVTTGVIAVVKSSLALSLGLVGALSIVRFRAAIKEPEELVYLFLCIAVGLALGAEQPLLAVAIVLAATVFIVGMYLSSGGSRQNRLLLTITGDSQRHFQDTESSVISVVDSVAGKYTLQRYDIDNGRGQLRIVLDESSPRKTVALIENIRKRLPDCDVSYVNLNSSL